MRRVSLSAHKYPSSVLRACMTVMVATAAHAVPIDLSDATPSITGPTTLHLDGVATMGSIYWSDLEWSDTRNVFVTVDYGEESPSGLVARWLFELNGDDETGNHDAEMIGPVQYVPSPGGWAFYTQDHTTWGEFSPGIPEITSGGIRFKFMLDTDFLATGHQQELVILSSGRNGHHIGDTAVLLRPQDGRLAFSQEVDTGGDLLLSNISEWTGQIWHTVTITWGDWGRRMVTDWNGGRDEAWDDLVRPCFNGDLAERRVINWKEDHDTPDTGLALDMLKIWSDE